MQASGQLKKMKTHPADPVKYFLDLNNESIYLNDLLGKSISLLFEQVIICVACGKQIKKAFGQGFCYPCFINSPENSECIVKPELCKAHLGQGRSIEWEEKNHLQPHYVYLALSSDVKVGVTRVSQTPTRWIDQGASQAIVIAKTPYRQLAGEIEVFLKKYLPDKTNWQRMLKNEMSADVDLLSDKKKAIALLPEDLKQYVFDEDDILKIHYPVLKYPLKVKSLSFDKQNEITGKLSGIKGQYLIFETGEVINIRNFSGYVITFKI